MKNALALLLCCTLALPAHGQPRTEREIEAAMAEAYSHLAPLGTGFTGLPFISDSEPILADARAPSVLLFTLRMPSHGVPLNLIGLRRETNGFRLFVSTQDWGNGETRPRPHCSALLDAPMARRLMSAWQASLRGARYQDSWYAAGGADGQFELYALKDASGWMAGEIWTPPLNKPYMTSLLSALGYAMRQYCEDRSPAAWRKLESAALALEKKLRAR